MKKMFGGMKSGMALAGLLVLSSAGTAVAQDRSDLERQIRELQQQVQELRRQLRDVDGRTPSAAPRIWTSPMPGGSSGWGPSIALFDRRSRLGVFVNTERNLETDSIGAVKTGSCVGCSTPPACSTVTAISEDRDGSAPTGTTTTEPSPGGSNVGPGAGAPPPGGNIHSWYCLPPGTGARSAPNTYA